MATHRSEHRNGSRRTTHERPHRACATGSQQSPIKHVIHFLRRTTFDGAAVSPQEAAALLDRANRLMNRFDGLALG